MPMIKSLSGWAAMTSLAFAGVARGQAVLTIPPASVVYERIDALTTLGLLDGVLTGERPLSVSRVARLFREARDNLGRLSPERRRIAERLLRDVQREAHLDATGAPDARQRLLESARLDLLYLDSPTRRVPSDSLGGIVATVNPLVANDDGRSWTNGWNVAVESVHELSLFDRVGLAVRPREAFFRDSLGRRQFAEGLEAAYTTLRLDNVVLEVGRDYVAFGQGVFAGLLVSDNAPALDMVRVANANPFRLPSFLRVFGPVSTDLFVADLGRDQNFPHAKLVGYSASMLPHPRLELGAEVLDNMGGDGAPGASFFGRVEDALVLPIPLLRKPDLRISNKLAGLNFKYRSPGNCYSVYGNGALDDADYRRIKSTLTQDAGYLLGVSAACLNASRGLSAAVEFQTTGIRYFTHDQFTSGVTSNGTIIGDQLGPRAYGALARFTSLAADGSELTADFDAEIRSGNQFAYHFTDSNFDNFGFRLVASRPPEQRQRVVLGWSSAGEKNVRLTFRGGVERVKNFDFIAGTRVNALAGARVAYSF
jgi:hypothetical protein